MAMSADLTNDPKKKTMAKYTAAAKKQVLLALL